MLAPVTHILPLTTIRRERVLPVPGKVLVRKGQKVNANDVVAEANLSPEHVLLDVARGLGLPLSKTDAHIHCKPGDQVAEGDVVAGPVGMARRVVRATRDGRVVLAGSGQVLLEGKGRPLELKAGIPGEVIELIPDRGGIIEATGALIQGIWGNGQIDSGLLAPSLSEPEAVLSTNQLDVKLRGLIVLAGSCESAEALRSAVEIPVRGLILASMSPELVEVAAQLPIPILLLEGFGRRTLNPAVYRLLHSSEQREIIVNAEAWDVYQGTRPEVMIPLPASGVAPLAHETETFALGKKVRVLRAPSAGQVGTLTDLRGTQRFASGLRALAGEVRLESGELLIVPLANLEILA